MSNTQRARRAAPERHAPHVPAMQLLPDGQDCDGLLMHGDNLDLLALLPPGVIDLIIADPPFGTGRVRAAVRNAATDPARGAKSTPTVPAAGFSFDDRWRGIADYLAFLRPRLVAMHQALAATGTLIIHLDYRVVHHVRLELDRIFGRRRFLNEIIWHYTGGGRAKRYFSRKHDTLLWYAKGPRWTFDIDAARVPYVPSSGYARSGIVARSGKRYRPHPQGTPVDDVWEIPIINPLAAERCGFPTQKPERLLQRIITTLSRARDLVLDPFCGSGTTALVAQRNGRRWIACDTSAVAIGIAQARLRDAGLGGRYRFHRLTGAVGAGAGQAGQSSA